MIWINSACRVVCVAVRLFVKCFGPSDAIAATKFLAVFEQLEFELLVIFVNVRQVGEAVTVALIEQFDNVSDFFCLLGCCGGVYSVVVGLDGEVGAPVAVDVVATNDDHQQSKQYEQPCRFFRHEPAFRA